jgi:hypothetical protein
MGQTGNNRHNKEQLEENDILRKVDIDTEYGSEKTTLFQVLE